MARGLEAVFAELGLTHYLGAFVDQGFDTWNTILDIQESDLYVPPLVLWLATVLTQLRDALGVKLGHRRKLQRRIANARGIAPSESLASPPKTSSEDAKQAGVRAEPTRSENHETQGVSKRKYRRHPKPDENAPERPPSAYVLFSNKMREDLKSQNLTFTEIAKLVGENWQILDPKEKETYESQANTSKEKYHRDLVEYKKTADFRRYSQYLQDFEEKQAKQNQDAAKRPKLDSGRARHGSTSSGTPAASNSSRGGGSTSTSGSGSGSERLQGSEPPPTQRERVNSVASVTESSVVPTRGARGLSAEDAGLSSSAAQLDMSSPREQLHGHARRQSALNGNRRNGESGRHNLPSLSDMLDDGGMGLSAPTEPRPSGSAFVGPNAWRKPDGAPIPPRATPARHDEPSPTGSNGSGGSSTLNRTEGPLPIHALLSDQSTAPSQPFRFGKNAAAAGADPGHTRERGSRCFEQALGTRGYGLQSVLSAFQHSRVEENGDGDVVMTAADSDHSRQQGSARGGFDGMSALLRAGEIVGRRHGD